MTGLTQCLRVSVVGLLRGTYNSGMSIAENIAAVRERVAAAAARVRRKPEDITLMAVSKTVEPERIRQAYEAGLRVFGENRVREFEKKAPALEDLQEAEWHLIGHLQSNKAKKAAELFNAVDAVDSLHLTQKLNEAAMQVGKTLPVLIEIKVSDEASKAGIPVGSPALEELLQAAAGLDHIQVRGLMTVPPFTENPEGARMYFRLLRDLRDQIAARKLPRIQMDVLSMGMSHDFEVAIEEGSTCVRVGTAIFGARPRP
ncbi:MAG: YggS family pyridoxal phosphate-dependent enzyme [Actinomycetota bacterium]